MIYSLLDASLSFPFTVTFIITQGHARLGRKFGGSKARFLVLLFHLLACVAPALDSIKDVLTHTTNKGL